MITNCLFLIKSHRLSLLGVIVSIFINAPSAAENIQIFGIEFGEKCSNVQHVVKKTTDGQKIHYWRCPAVSRNTDQVFTDIKVQALPKSKILWTVVARSKFMELETCEKKALALETQVKRKRPSKRGCDNSFSFYQQHKNLCFYITCATNFSGNRGQLLAEFIDNRFYPEMYYEEREKFLDEKQNLADEQLLEGINLENF